MAVKITGGQLLKLLHHLKRYGTHSAVISGVVNSVSRGDPHGLQVWANKETEPNVVVVSADETKCKNSYCRKLAFVYSTDNNATDLGNVLHSPGVLNPKTEIHFRDVLTPTMDAVESLLSPGKGKVTPITDRLVHFEITSENDIPDCQLSDSFRLGEFTPEIAKMAASSWVQKGPEISDHFNDLNQWGYRPVVVYQNNSKLPVAWMMQNFYGPILSFYIKPEFRRSGVGRSAGSELVRQLFRKDGRVLGLVEITNEVTLGCIHLIGFKKIDGVESVYKVIDISNK